MALTWHGKAARLHPASSNSTQDWVCLPFHLREQHQSSLKAETHSKVTGYGAEFCFCWWWRFYKVSSHTHCWGIFKQITTVVHRAAFSWNVHVSVTICIWSFCSPLFVLGIALLAMITSCPVLLSRWTTQKGQGEEGTSPPSCMQGADAPHSQLPVLLLPSDLRRLVRHKTQECMCPLLPYRQHLLIQKAKNVLKIHHYRSWEKT